MLLISLLGERTAIDAVTDEVRTRSSRTIALIAFLALHAGLPQPRARIAAAFWPDSPEQQALTNLRRELHQLRRVLDDDESIEVSPTDLTWREGPSCSVDLLSFRRARAQALAAGPDAPELVLEHGVAALAAYAGELLPGLYDEWLLPERALLAEEAGELCRLVSDAGRRTGRWKTAVAAARRRIALAPFEEGGYQELIRLQTASGDRAGALSTFHHCASVLESELGLQPDRTTQALVDGIRDRPAEPARSSRREPNSPTPAATGLVGRGDELRALSDALDDSARGCARAFVVTGPPGVGKTHLVDELVRLARRQSVVVATARCYGVPGRLALAPVAEWLGEHDLSRTVASLSPVWRAEVDRLLPGPKEGGVGPAPRGVVDAWQRHRFFQGLSQALRATRRPLVLVLENLQWCDEETLDLVTFLLGNERDQPLLVLLTARDRELAASSRHAEWVRRTRASGLLGELELAPLDLAEATEMLRGLAREVSDEVAAVLHSATGGFPLYLVEATRHHRDLADLASGSPDLAAVLQGRFEQLSETGRKVAELGAAVGRDFDLELLCEASDLTPDAVVQAVDELWRLRILRELRGGYDFSHDLLREAAYQLIGPPRRWLLHRRLAQALEILHAGATDEVAGQLADQYSRAGLNARAVQHHHRAGEVAAGVFAHAEAVLHYRSGLTLLATLTPGADRDRQEIRTLAALAASLNAHRGYSDPELAETLERSIELAERLSERGSRVDALVGLWAARFVQGDVGRAHAIAERAVALTRSSAADSPLAAQADFAFAGSALSLGMPALAAEHFEQCCSVSDDETSLSIGSLPAIHARAWSAHAYWLLGDGVRAAGCAQEGIDRARSVEHPYSLAIALGYAALTWQLLAEPERLQSATAELAELSNRHGFAYYSDWGIVLSGWAHPDDLVATGQMERGIACLREVGAFSRMPYWLSLLAERVVEPARARALLDAAVVSARGRRDLWWLPEVLRRRAALLPDEKAAATLVQALDLARQHGSTTLVERCERDLVVLGERFPNGAPPSVGHESLERATTTAWRPA